jgi:hypothetical protein
MQSKCSVMHISNVLNDCDNCMRSTHGVSDVSVAYIYMCTGEIPRCQGGDIYSFGTSDICTV